MTYKLGGFGGRGVIMHSTFPRCIVPEPPFTYTFMIDRGLYTQKIEQIQNKPVLVYYM